MAWALKQPDGFGQYWPDGNFGNHLPNGGYQTWHEQLRVYARANMTVEQKKQFEIDGNTDTLHISSKFRSGNDTVVFEECPTSFDTVKTYKELHSMVATESRVLAVNEDLKNLIELFEPGVHQFFPFEINMPKGKVFPKQYYILIIRRHLEGVLPVEGTCRNESYTSNGKKKFRFYPLNGNKSGYSQLNVSNAAIGQAHIWRDKRMNNPNVFISDALQKAIKEADLTIFRHYKVKEV